MATQVRQSTLAVLVCEHDPADLLLLHRLEQLSEKVGLNRIGPVHAVVGHLGALLLFENERVVWFVDGAFDFAVANVLVGLTFIDHVHGCIVVLDLRVSLVQLRQVQ